jgi:hypothetical protein
MSFDTFPVKGENERLVLYTLYLKTPTMFASGRSSVPLLLVTFYSLQLRSQRDKHRGQIKLEFGFDFEGFQKLFIAP